MEESNINVEVKQQGNYENKLVVKSDNYISFIFTSILVLFLGALVSCILLLSPQSLIIKPKILQLVLVVFILFNLVSVILRKVPSVKTYIILISFLLGLVIGV